MGNYLACNFLTGLINARTVEKPIVLYIKNSQHNSANGDSNKNRKQEQNTI
jgi:hypothetical protein